MLPRFQDGDHVGVLLYCWEVLHEKSRIKYRDEDGYSPLQKVLQSPVQYTIKDWRLTDGRTDGHVHT